MLTALDALLVSLYGYRHDGGDPPAEKRETSPSSQSAERVNGLGNLRDRFLNEAPEHGAAARATSAAASLDRRLSNGSSSSSVAEDWVVDRFPAGLETDVSLCDDETAQSKDRISAEAWSRGTALTDPVSGEPLRPVEIHRPSKHSRSDSDEIESRSVSDKKAFNAITEKRAALTAYDLISNRAMRAPLSPAGLFEKEARAEVLREKPTAGLQEISDTVHQRWKNLREEERKK